MQLSEIMPSTVDIWEERAIKVLSHFTFNSPDELDMYEVCRRYGIKIMPLDPVFFDGDLYDDMKSYARPFSKGRKGIIYLKPGLDAIEKKLILAEEFCHLYAHHLNQLGTSSYVVNKMENQAKRMAAYLLMPTSYMEDIYTAALDDRVLVSDIADYFVITEEMAHYRLQLTYNHRVDEFVSFKGKVGSIEWFE